MNVPVKLAERPLRDARRSARRIRRAAAAVGLHAAPALGLSVRDLDREFADRYRLPDGSQGVIIVARRTHEPGLRRRHRAGLVLLEINRHPVRSIDDYRRLTAGAVRATS